MHILIIEDDLDLGRALQKALKLEGFSSEWLRQAVDAPRSFEGLHYACILLDLSLPDGDGQALLSRWRREGVAIPIIIMTARAALEERIAGLDGGADDFIVKPFATVELASRMRAVLRRYAQQSRQVWTIGDLELEPKSHLARLAGSPVDLSPREFQLMLELAREPGVVVSKSVLSERLEPLGEPVNFGAIDVHIFNLRGKIGGHRIRTVRGVGYMLVRC
ncbi:response regulator [Massilia sp. P8910]|uniref:response regulator n=1 Tax=Massilia antarctica TaxID=2765360 RepID=UPI001E31438C|nr:response regulator [Massilia antarctica]MCE3605691.1 response regulator [Massilia antarctica]